MQQHLDGVSTLGQTHAGGLQQKCCPVHKRCTESTLVPSSKNQTSLRRGPTFLGRAPNCQRLVDATSNRVPSDQPGRTNKLTRPGDRKLPGDSAVKRPMQQHPPSCTHVHRDPPGRQLHPDHPPETDHSNFTHIHNPPSHETPPNDTPPRGTSRQHVVKPRTYIVRRNSSYCIAERRSDRPGSNYLSLTRLC